jgi:hypothetical protein
VETIREKRSIAPNEGFVEQLIELNDAVHGFASSQKSDAARRI